MKKGGRKKKREATTSGQNRHNCKSSVKKTESRCVRTWKYEKRTQIQRNGERGRLVVRPESC